MDHPPDGTIVAFNFTVPDLDQAEAFYTQLFGWQFFPFLKDKLRFFRTPGDAGPAGCLTVGPVATSGGLCASIQAADIDAALVKATRLGCTTLAPKTAIPGGRGFFAVIRVPDGNVFGWHTR